MGSQTFSPTIQKSINLVQRKSVDAYPGSAQADLLPADRWPLCLESLRRALLMKGEPLEGILLRSEDLSLVRRFLAQCGFSEKTLTGFIRELMEQNSSREIKLSELLGKLVELGPPNREIHHSLTLEPSIIPYFESVLRDCGLIPKQIEDVFNAARAEGGGLELNRLVAELKAVKTKVTDVGKPASNGHNLDQLIRAIAEAISRQTPSKVVEGASCRLK